MLSLFGTIESSVYVQMVTFLILLPAYYLSQRRLPSRLAFGFTLLRIIVLSLIFSYFTMTWSSAVNPSLRSASVMGMLLINLYFLWQIILSRLEIPYRLALETASREPANAVQLQRTMQLGKRFYYYRYFWQAIISGSSPRRFLHGLAGEQVRYDLKTVFLEHGTQKEFVSLKMQLAFLRDRLNHDDTMPPEFKARFRQAIDDFGSHAWIEEQVNSFLGQVIDTPESLFASPWAVEVEKK